MNKIKPLKPVVGVVGMAYPGYHLGDEMCAAKLAEMMHYLHDANFELYASETNVTDEFSAQRAGRMFAQKKVDCILAVITTFVPDYFIAALLDQCDVPVFLWAVEREIHCLALVCGPLITATLYNLGKHYRLVGANIPDPSARTRFQAFARGAMARRALRSMRVSYIGGKPSIMFSLSVNEYELKKQLGITVLNQPVDEFYGLAKALPEQDVRACWAETKKHVGCVAVSEPDGLLSARYLLAGQRLAEQYALDAISINCFPCLKSKICLAVSRWNDGGIAAGCEGDLHSTILMFLLSSLTGKAAFNGDFLRLYPEDNSVLFSHCGAGALSLAKCPADISLRASMETEDGLAVFYPTAMEGPVTLVNLMSDGNILRLAVMCGEGTQTDLEYQGTPLRVRFSDDVKTVVERVSRLGAGHHWNGGAADLMEELSVLCELTGLKFNAITESRKK